MNNQSSHESKKLYFSLVKETLPPSFDSSNSLIPHCGTRTICALWLQTGSVHINNRHLSQGEGRYFGFDDSIVNSGSENALILRFIISADPLINTQPLTGNGLICDTIFSRSINIEATDFLLRLDQVDFPPSAMAYKHTHPGPGIRYLVNGELTLCSDHAEQVIAPGNAWFEEANSPVVAIAAQDGPSVFVRTMLLPLAYADRSTFTLHDKADVHKPRLQSNTRHFEQRISITLFH